MKRIIRRVVTVVTTETWTVEDDENDAEIRIVELFTVERMLKNDDHEIQAETLRLDEARDGDKEA